MDIAHDESFELSDFGAAGVDGGCEAASGDPSSPAFWRACYEQERARAEAAEARCDALRIQEVDARSRLGSLRTVFETNKAKLEATRDELRALRRASRETVKLQGEVKRLQGLLDAAGVDHRKNDALMSLRREVCTLRARVRELEQDKEAQAARIKELEAELEAARSTGAQLSKTVYGSRSEKQKKPPSDRPRGQQPGSEGHGRTPRPDLEETEEVHDVAEDARVCPCCGKPYVANGAQVSSVIEIEVKAHLRRIERPRWQQGCTCPEAPGEVTAPPVPRLFPNTMFGISVWLHVLIEHFVFFRPYRRIAAWLEGHGLPLSAGTMASNTGKFLALFAPLYEAILEHQNRATLRHADETSWRVREFGDDGGARRGWMWVSLSADAVCYHIDRFRSAEAARKLIASIPDGAGPVFLVCDRYSAYKKLAREFAGMLILCACWAHARRDYLKCAAGCPDLEAWSLEWIGRIGEIYRLNADRLVHYDPEEPCQGAEFAAADTALREAVDALFATAEVELDALPDGARQGTALRSLINHREALSVFVDHPRVPMDNNTCENVQRDPVIGRKLSFGSDSVTGARLTGVMLSVLGTIILCGLDVRAWLEQWLTECARNGGHPPDDLSGWLPWTMSATQKDNFRPPG